MRARVCACVACAQEAGFFVKTVDVDQLIGPPYSFESIRFRVQFTRVLNDDFEGSVRSVRSVRSVQNRCNGSVRALI